MNLETFVNVVSAEVVGPYQIRLTFDDGLERVIDFREVLHGPVFAPLHDQTIFAQVTVNQDTGTIEWPTGADFSPVVLHDWPDYVEVLKQQQRHLAVV
ncbi:MAG: DUF2442 domain-containing protein [Caldilineaceae bacterium]|nr:DUF2442 domain-containing protein [Caldilineaceae bacterium]